MKNPFPDFNPEETRKRIALFWDLTGLFPVPNFQPDCPICKSKLILLKSARFHTRGAYSQTKFRCDIKFKCMTCSYTWAHGLVVPEKMAKKHKMDKILHFRELKRMLEKQ